VVTPDLLRILYESPAVVAMGPLWSALFVGFAAVDWWGRVYLTAAGAEYLARRT
jgi:hypothetical protein